MTDKLIEIAKECGAVNGSDWDGHWTNSDSVIFDSEDQLHATVEQVCAPLEKQLIDARATFVALPPFGGTVDGQIRLAIKRINDTLIAYHDFIGSTP